MKKVKNEQIGYIPLDGQQNSDIALQFSVFCTKSSLFSHFPMLERTSTGVHLLVPSYQVSISNAYIDNAQIFPQVVQEHFSKAESALQQSERFPLK
jgi:hypothetical protein